MSICRVRVAERNSFANELQATCSRALLQRKTGLDQLMSVIEHIKEEQRRVSEGVGLWLLLYPAVRMKLRSNWLAKTDFQKYDVYRHDS